jgi:ABC-2 type transport system permease protein
MPVILRKELADHFSSVRFLILFCLITMVAMVSSYMVGAGLQEKFSGVAKPTYVFLLLFSMTGKLFSLDQFIAFFGPLIGLVMGFDAINRERNSGTLSKVLSQPIYRDAVIIGKFLAGVITITVMLTSLMLLISGLGLVTLGIVPGGEEVIRLAVHLVISIAYVSFWLGISILFSIVFRSVATSALAGVALWIFFSFFIAFSADFVANAVAPVDNPQNMEQVLKHDQIAQATSLISPVVLYSEATSTILDPFRRTAKNMMMIGRIERISMSRYRNPLPIEQSVLVVVPYLTSLLALTFIGFGVSYLVFMRQEIRSV